MRILFLRGKQKELLTKYKQLKKCTWNSLAKTFGVSIKTIKNWKNEEFTLPKDIFEIILSDFSELSKFKKYIQEEKKENWGQKKAGKYSWRKRKELIKTNSKFRSKWLKACKKGGISNVKKGLIKNWEIGFRNIGRRKITGPKGEKMFNKTERKIAQLLLTNGIDYEYEPQIKINGKNYFPDFIINDIIIERCGLYSKKYISALKKKLKDYLSWKGQIIIVLPSKVNKNLEKHLTIPKKFLTIIEDERFEEKLIESLGR